MKEIAIIGPTASGKSALALKIAKLSNAIILSLDSLAIYKEIDIVSAKPTKEELCSIKHIGIDEIYPNEYFSVEQYIQLYKQASAEARKYHANLIIVGGSSFYLKALQTGLSPHPRFKRETIKKVTDIMTKGIDRAYQMLREVDDTFATRITIHDKYRIEKGLSIYYETGMKPTEYFAKNPPKPIIKDIPIFEIEVKREQLRQRILTRTKQMLQMGLIDEIAYLEKKYGRDINPMKAIGIKETLQYLDGKIKTENELIESITTHSAQLAKRQQTFNKTQFAKKISLPLQELEKEIQKQLAV